MGRIKRDYKRKSGFRDARLIVVATEGKKTEPKYFEALRTYPKFYNPKVHLEIIPSSNGYSAPKYVLQNLNEFKKEYRMREDDELWMVIDRDFQSWSVKELKLCIQLCKQKKYSLALSTPCFELWLLLHFVCVASASEREKNLLLQNAKTDKQNYCVQQLKLSMKSYKKSKPNFDKIVKQTEIAIERAQKLNAGNVNHLLNQLGTNVYILAEKIIQLQ